MAHNLSLAAEDALTTISMPEDGDDLDASVVETIVQLLGNKSVMHRTAFLGHIAWTERMSVAPGGSLTSFSIAIGGILRVVGDDSTGVRRAAGAAAATITQTAIEGGGGTLGASARWWYVYAFLTTAGTVDYAISLTGPGAYGRVKDGDTTRVYLGCFRTTAAGAPLPGRKSNGRWVYRRSAMASNETRVLNASASAGPADLDLSALVPPHARLATLALACVGGDGGFSVSIYADGDTSDIALFQRAEIGLTSPSITGDVECTAAQLVDCTTVRSGTTGGATAHVHGFYE